MSKTVHKALDILEALAGTADGVSLAKLSQELNMHPSTVHRLLKTLMERRFVRRDPLTRQYALGFRLVELGSAVPYQTHLIETARPILTALVQDVGETANLVVRYQDDAVYIDQVQCNAVVTAFTQTGARAPLHCTGVGKVFLAHSSPGDFERFIEGASLPAYTSHTMTNPYVLKEHLERIRKQGFALDNEERELGTHCLAAPVRDASGAVIAAISVSGPAQRLQENRLNSVASQVRRAAAEISTRMGFVDKTTE